MIILSSISFDRAFIYRIVITILFGISEGKIKECKETHSYRIRLKSKNCKNPEEERKGAQSPIL
jgi:hypothetical protein